MEEKKQNEIEPDLMVGLGEVICPEPRYGIVYVDDNGLWQLDRWLFHCKEDAEKAHVSGSRRIFMIDKVIFYEELDDE